MLIRLLCSALLLWPAFPLPAATLSLAPLSITQAQRLAVDRSRGLSAQDSAVAAARDMAVAAGQLPDPVLKLGVENLPVTGDDRFSLTRDFMTMRRVGLAQEYTRSAKRELRAERFERQADKMLAEKSATVASIQRETALAWLDRYYAEAVATLLAEQSREAALEVEAAQSAYRGGRGSQADVIAARSAQAMLDDRGSESVRRIQTAKTMLARWVGEAAAAPLAGKPAIDTVRVDAHSLDYQLAGHPEIAALAAQEKIAEAEAHLAEANKKADWSVELAYSQRGPAYSNMVSFGVSVPLQWDQKRRQDREVAAKLAQVDEARGQRDEALRMHVAEVRVMHEQWENGRERLARYQGELIPLAGERTQAALAAYRGGKASINEVLQARRGDIEVRIQALQIELDTARLWAQLNFLFPDGEDHK